MRTAGGRGAALSSGAGAGGSGGAASGWCIQWRQWLTERRSFNQPSIHASIVTIEVNCFCGISTLPLCALQVAVVQRYQAEQARAAAAGQQTDEDTNSADSGGGLSTVLLNIGVISPVTKATAGTQYHEQLARQLVDFLGGGGKR